MRIPAWLSRISQPDALSMQAWLLLSVPSLMWGAAYLLTRTSMAPVLAVLWSVVPWLALGLVWLIARLTWMRAGSRQLRAALILPTLAGAALARSVMMVWIGGGLQGGPNPIPLGVLVFSILSVGALLLAEAFRELKLKNGRLSAIRDTLAESDTRARMESEALRSSARQVVAAAVENALKAERSGERAAIRLRQVSDEVVRPLSHTLALTADEDVVSIAPSPRRDLGALARAILASDPVRPLVIAALSVMMTLNVIAVTFGGPIALIAALVMGVTIAAMLLPVRYVPWARLPVGLGMSGLVAALAVAGFVSGLVMTAIPAPRDESGGASLLIAVVVLLCGAFVAVMRGLLRQQEEVEEDLVTEGRRLVVVGRATQARIRRDRRHLAQVLHGVVQPRIVARSIRLQSAGEPIDVEELVDELDSLLSQQKSSDSAIDLRRSLQDVAKVWSGSAVLKVDLTGDVEEALAGQEATSRAVVDIACEAVNNAVLRGGATRVDLSVSLSDAMVTIVVRNGAAASSAAKAPSSASGLGSRTFDDLADTWSLESEDGVTVFMATVGLPGGPRLAKTDVELPAV
jgi:hypothetical protein